MSRQPSWREIARVLAERVEHFAGEAGSADRGSPFQTTGCAHPPAEADPDNCAPCADRAAFLLYQQKLRLVPTGSSATSGGGPDA